MSKSVLKFLFGIAIAAIVVLGSLGIYVIAANQESTVASGAIKIITNTAPQTKQVNKPVNPDAPLSYCERKLSQLRTNYNQVIFVDNNPENYRVVSSDLVKYNYNKAFVEN